MKVTTVFFFSNGNTAVCGEDGHQIPELQSSWMLDALETMRGKGAEIDENCLIIIPSGDRVKIFRTNEGWNWEVRKI